MISITEMEIATDHRSVEIATDLIYSTVNPVHLLDNGYLIEPATSKGMALRL